MYPRKSYLALHFFELWRYTREWKSINSLAEYTHYYFFFFVGVNIHTRTQTYSHSLHTYKLCTSTHTKASQKFLSPTKFCPKI